MNRPTISLCLIVKNEVHHLRPLLESVEDCFDQIVVADTGSTDGTIELAKELGCEVHHFDWIDDFAAARNFSFSKATSDYVCWLDADDALNNTEGFKKFRDHVMHLGEYWLADYHYSYDFLNKRPNCTFVRERIVKRDRGFTWKYFVHEGILGADGSIPSQPQHTNAFNVIHRRTDEDIKSDKHRNLKIFEKHLDKLDGRMTYYYGKELFENGMAKEGLVWLEKAFAMPDMAPHDRILCAQFMAYAAMSVNDLATAYRYANAGMILAPNRAEFYIVMGDIKVKENDLVNALPLFGAATYCQPRTAGPTSFIFFTEEAYTTYPRNQMIKIMANTGKLDEAERLAVETWAHFKHPETAELIKGIQQVKAENTFDYLEAKPCDDILISCLNSAFEWDGNIYRKQGIGGSETAEIELAERWARLTGRQVLIYNSVTEERLINGVTYRPVSQLKGYIEKHKPWVHVAWRHNQKLTAAPTIVHCHDLNTRGLEDSSTYEKAAVLTPFHANFANATQGLPETKMFRTRNGIVSERFKDIDVNEKDPFAFIFSSSPDRGLDRAMLVLDKVREKFPKITLSIFYGIEHLPKYNHQVLHDKLKAMMEERKDWVFYRGKVEQLEMMKAFRKASYCVQPSDWLETAGISGLEQICSGVYPLFRKVGGIADTLGPFAEQGMASLVASDCIKPEEFQLYIDETIRAVEEERYKRVKVDASTLDWEGCALQWLKEFEEVTRGTKG